MIRASDTFPIISGMEISFPECGLKIRVLKLGKRKGVLQVFHCSSCTVHPPAVDPLPIKVENPPGNIIAAFSHEGSAIAFVKQFPGQPFCISSRRKL